MRRKVTRYPYGAEIVKRRRASKNRRDLKGRNLAAQ